MCSFSAGVKNNWQPKKIMDEAIAEVLADIKWRYFDRHCHSVVENDSIQITSDINPVEDLSRFADHTESNNMTPRDFRRLLVLQSSVNHLYHDYSHAMSGEIEGTTRMVVVEDPWKRVLLDCENGCAQRCGEEEILTFDQIRPPLVCSAFERGNVA